MPKAQHQNPSQSIKQPRNTKCWITSIRVLSHFPHQIDHGIPLLPVVTSRHTHSQCYRPFSWCGLGKV